MCKMENKIPNSFGISNGIRQGSVLSPKVFAIYNDGLSVLLSCRLYTCMVSKYFMELK